MAAFVGTTISDCEKFCVSVHKFVVAFKLVIAVFTNAVDAAFVELSVAVLVNTEKSKSVEAVERNVKLVSLPIKSVPIAGQVIVELQLISSLDI